jgi:hypothetical protein
MFGKPPKYVTLDSQQNITGKKRFITPLSDSNLVDIHSNQLITNKSFQNLDVQGLLTVQGAELIDVASSQTLAHKTLDSTCVVPTTILSGNLTSSQIPADLTFNTLLVNGGVQNTDWQTGTLAVIGDVGVSGSMRLFGDIDVTFGGLNVEAASTFTGDVSVGGVLRVIGEIVVTENTTQTLTHKTLDSTCTVPTSILSGTIPTSSLSGTITNAQLQTTYCNLTSAQTLTNKSLSTGCVVPASLLTGMTAAYCDLTTTQTLTNKSLSTGCVVPASLLTGMTAAYCDLTTTQTLSNKSLSGCSVPAGQSFATPTLFATTNLDTPSWTHSGDIGITTNNGKITLYGLNGTAITYGNLQISNGTLTLSAGTNFVTPSTNQLGYTLTATLSGSSTFTTSGTTVLSYGSLALPSGVWLVAYCAFVQCTTISTTSGCITSKLSTTSNSDVTGSNFKNTNIGPIGVTTNNTAYPSAAESRVFTIAASASTTTVYLNLQMVFSSGAFSAYASTSSLTATRIA